MALRSERPKKEKKDTQTEYTCASPQCLLSVQWPYSGSLNQRKQMEPEGDPNIWQENKAGKQLGFAGSSGHFVASEVVMLLYSPTASCRHPKNPQYRPRSLHTQSWPERSSCSHSFPNYTQSMALRGSVERKAWGRSTTQKSLAMIFSSVLNIYIKPLNNISV